MEVLAHKDRKERWGHKEPLAQSDRKDLPEKQHPLPRRRI